MRAQALGRGAGSAGEDQVPGALLACVRRLGAALQRPAQAVRLLQQFGVVQGRQRHRAAAASARIDDPVHWLATWVGNPRPRTGSASISGPRAGSRLHRGMALHLLAWEGDGDGRPVDHDPFGLDQRRQDQQAGQ